MPLIDTHCHYNLEPLYSNWPNHWAQALENGIAQSIIVGAGLRSSQKAVEIAQKENELYAAVGIHPERSLKITDLNQSLDQLEKIAQNKKVVAIGEIGLDYFHLEKSQAQKDLFIGQISLAKRLNLPIILHVRDKEEAAYFETLEVLEEHWHFKKAVVFHCVSGPLKYVKKALDYPNSYFGFDGNITFKNADHLREIFQLVQKTAPHKILLETDAPYLAPVPWRGQLCEPKMIAQTAKYLSENFQLDLDKVYQNSLDAFALSYKL